MAQADKALFLWVNGLVGTFAPLDQVMEWLVSDYLVPAVLALTLVALWFAGQDGEARQRSQIGLFAALTSMGLSSLVVFITNAVYSRPRPFEVLEVTPLFYQPTDPSFPANSAAAAFGIAAAVWGVNRRVGTGLMIAAALFGFARVYAGVHYPLDIVGGALIGIVVASLVLRLRNLILPVLVAVIRAARILCLA